MKNQTGSVSPLFLIFLITLFFSILMVIKVRINNIHKLNLKMEHSLCVKKTNGILKEFNFKMKKSNSALKFATLGKLTSIAAPPGVNIALNRGSKAIIKGLKLYQLKLYISLLNHFKSLVLKKCFLSTSFVKSPYRFKINGFERDQLNQAIARESIWKISLTKLPFISTINFRLKDSMTKTSMKKVPFF